MWDKFASRERDRQLALLFVAVLIGFCIYGVVADRSPTAARVIAAIFGAAFVAMLVRLFASRSWAKSGQTPVGTLSPDERAKARIKLKSAPPAVKRF